MYSYVVRQVQPVAMVMMWTQVDGIDRGRKLHWLGWFHDCVLPQSSAKDPGNCGAFVGPQEVELELWSHW